MNEVFLRKIFPELFMDKEAQYLQLDLQQRNHMDDTYGNKKWQSKYSKMPTVNLDEGYTGFLCRTLVTPL